MGQFGPAEPGESVIAYELEAVAGELRHAAGYLTDLASDSSSILSAEERHLARLANGWGRRVLRIAASIEQAPAE